MQPESLHPIGNQKPGFLVTDGGSTESGWAGLPVGAGNDGVIGAGNDGVVKPAMGHGLQVTQKRF